jgi:hypothetical protein
VLAEAPSSIAVRALTLPTPLLTSLTARLLTLPHVGNARFSSPSLVDMVRSSPVERPIFTAIDFVLDRSASGVARAAPSLAMMPIAGTRKR